MDYVNELGNAKREKISMSVSLEIEKTKTKYLKEEISKLQKENRDVCKSLNLCIEKLETLGIHYDAEKEVFADISMFKDAI